MRIDMEDSSTTERRSTSTGAARGGPRQRRDRPPGHAQTDLDDVLDLVALAPNVRVCKGIYVEPADLAYQGDEAIRFAFVEAMAALWEGGAKVAVATHDEWLVAEALRLIEERGLGRERYEFQMLLGVREALADELARDGHTLRVYVPYGRQWYEYSLRRLQENPKVAGYVARHPPASEAVNGLSWRFVTIAGLFVTSLVVSNIIAVKLAEVGGRVFDAGNVLFPLAYLLGDVLTEVYGFRAARRVILLGFACNVLAVGAIQVALRLPAADFWLENQEAYETVLGTTWRIFVASLVAYLAGELTNSYVLSRMKVATGGRFLWSRTIGSVARRPGPRHRSVRDDRVRRDGRAAPGHDRDHVGDQGGVPRRLVANWLKRSEGVDVFDVPRAAQART